MLIIPNLNSLGAEASVKTSAPAVKSIFFEVQAGLVRAENLYDMRCQNAFMRAQNSMKCEVSEDSLFDCEEGLEFYRLGFFKRFFGVFRHQFGQEFKPLISKEPPMAEDLETYIKTLIGRAIEEHLEEEKLLKLLDANNFEIVHELPSDENLKREFNLTAVNFMHKILNLKLEDLPRLSEAQFHRLQNHFARCNIDLSHEFIQKMEDVFEELRAQYMPRLAENVISFKPRVN